LFCRQGKLGECKSDGYFANPGLCCKYLHKIDRFKVEFVHIFGDNHDRDTESRQSPKITAHGENHGNREFVTD